jgi:ribonuclease T1
VKRAWVGHCFVALLVVLSGCGKGGQGSQPTADNAGAPGIQASAPRAVSTETQADTASPGSGTGWETVAIAQLPKQAVTTLRRIEAGGPFPFGKDGVVFGNRERLLPPHPRGFYHEYTVPTPRARDRGARRIVCGGARQQIDTCYYSDDHYASFKRIAG